MDDDQLRVYGFIVGLVYSLLQFEVAVAMLFVSGRSVVFCFPPPPQFLHYCAASVCTRRRRVLGTYEGREEPEGGGSIIVSSACLLCINVKWPRNEYLTHIHT